MLDGNYAVSIQGVPSHFYTLLGHSMIHLSEKQSREVNILHMQELVLSIDVLATSSGRDQAWDERS